MLSSLKKRLLLEPIDFNLKNPIWFHVASIGEFNSAKFIIDFFSKKKDVLVTYFSFRKATEFFFKDQVSYRTWPIPFDFPFLVEKWYKSVEPSFSIFVEKELWPFLIKKNNSKKAIINAFAPKNFIEKSLISQFDLVLAKNKEAFDRIKVLNKKSFLCGNLKIASFNFVENNTSQNIITAGSTHEKEETIIIESFKKLKNKVPNLKLIIAPRHVERSKDILKKIIGYGFKASLFSSNEDSEIVVLDSIGKLKEFYKISKIAIVGGSFVDGIGGHNIIEPLSFGKPVLVGPYIKKIKDIVDIFADKGIVFIADSVNTLYEKALKIIKEDKIKKENFEDLNNLAKNIRECYLNKLEEFINA